MTLHIFHVEEAMCICHILIHENRQVIYASHIILNFLDKIMTMNQG